MFLANYFEHKNDTSIIALGPLTNIARALQTNPKLGKHCKRFISMGGSFKSHGNCSPVAEYNYWCDPHAAQYVFENLDKKIEMVGLDITRHIVLTPIIYLIWSVLIQTYQVLSKNHKVLLRFSLAI